MGDEERLKDSMITDWIRSREKGKGKREKGKGKKAEGKMKSRYVFEFNFL